MADNPVSAVYAITCVPTGEQYVGASKNIQQRWANHRHVLRKAQHHSQRLQDAWNEHGAENISFTVLEECAAADLWAAEIDWIRELRPAFNRYIVRSGHDGLFMPNTVEVPEEEEVSAAWCAIPLDLAAELAKAAKTIDRSPAWCFQGAIELWLRLNREDIEEIRQSIDFRAKHRNLFEQFRKQA